MTLDQIREHVSLALNEIQRLEASRSMDAPVHITASGLGLEGSHSSLDKNAIRHASLITNLWMVTLEICTRLEMLEPTEVRDIK